MSPVRPRSPAPKPALLRYTLLHSAGCARKRRPCEARYPSGKGEVCKTFMRRFDPGPRLQLLSRFVQIQSVRRKSSAEIVAAGRDWSAFTTRKRSISRHRSSPGQTYPSRSAVACHGSQTCRHRYSSLVGSENDRRTITRTTGALSVSETNLAGPGLNAAENRLDKPFGLPTPADNRSLPQNRPLGSS
jgi:hypothetical protein